MDDQSIDGGSAPSAEPKASVRALAARRERDIFVSFAQMLAGSVFLGTDAALRKINPDSSLLAKRVEAEQPLSDGKPALDTIGDEHRSIAVVVSAMRDIANVRVARPADRADQVGVDLQSRLKQRNTPQQQGFAFAVFPVASLTLINSLG